MTRDAITTWHTATGGPSPPPTVGIIGEYDREAMAREVAELRRSNRLRRRNAWRFPHVLSRPVARRVEPTT